jgi:hypothetical protein
VGPRAGLDAVEKRKITSPRRESKPLTPTVQPVASRYTDSITFSAEKNITFHPNPFSSFGDVTRRLSEERTNGETKFRLDMLYILRR